MMIPNVVLWVALVLGIVTSAGLLITRLWRLQIAFLGGLYLCAFVLILSNWPISMAASKLVTGWMACAILTIAQLNASRRGEGISASNHSGLFLFFAAGVVIVATFGVSTHLAIWLGISIPVAWSCLVVMGLGLLHLGMTSDPLRVIIGLLSFFAGFEILYTSVESSILVTALLALVNLGLAMSGAFFLSRTETQEL
jgi:hypothetical protein